MDTTRERLFVPRAGGARRLAERKDREGDSSFPTRTLRQLAVCAIVGLVLVGVSRADNQLCKDVTAAVKSTLVYTIDYKKAAAEMVAVVVRAPELWKSLMAPGGADASEETQTPPVSDAPADAAQAPAPDRPDSQGENPGEGEGENAVDN